MRKLIHFWIVAYATDSRVRGVDHDRQLYGEPRRLMTLDPWQEIIPLSRTWRTARGAMPDDSFGDGTGVRTGYPLHVVIRDWSGVDSYGFADHRPPWEVAEDPRPMWLRTTNALPG